MRLMLNPLTVVGVSSVDDGQGGVESVATVGSHGGRRAAPNWTVAGRTPAGPTY